MKRRVLGIILVILTATVSIGCTMPSDGIPFWRDSPDISVICRHEGHDILCTYQGGDDDTRLAYLSFIFNTMAAQNTVSSTGALGMGPGVKPSVGSVVTFKGIAGEGDHIVVIAHLVDGTEGLVLDSYL